MKNKSIMSTVYSKFLPFSVSLSTYLFKTWRILIAHVISLLKNWVWANRTQEGNRLQEKKGENNTGRENPCIQHINVSWLRNTRMQINDNCVTCQKSIYWNIYQKFYSNYYKMILKTLFFKNILQYRHIIKWIQMEMINLADFLACCPKCSFHQH